MKTSTLGTKQSRTIRGCPITRHPERKRRISYFKTRFLTTFIPRCTMIAIFLCNQIAWAYPDIRKETLAARSKLETVEFRENAGEIEEEGAIIYLASKLYEIAETNRLDKEGLTAQARHILRDELKYGPIDEILDDCQIEGRGSRLVISISVKLKGRNAKIIAYKDSAQSTILDESGECILEGNIGKIRFKVIDITTEDELINKVWEALNDKDMPSYEKYTAELENRFGFKTIFLNGSAAVKVLENTLTKISSILKSLAEEGRVTYGTMVGVTDSIGFCLENYYQHVAPGDDWGTLLLRKVKDDSLGAGLEYYVIDGGKGFPKEVDSMVKPGKGFGPYGLSEHEEGISRAFALVHDFRIWSRDTCWYRYANEYWDWEDPKPFYENIIRIGNEKLMFYTTFEGVVVDSGKDKIKRIDYNTSIEYAGVEIFFGNFGFYVRTREKTNGTKVYGNRYNKTPNTTETNLTNISPKASPSPSPSRQSQGLSGDSFNILTEEEKELLKHGREVHITESPLGRRGLREERIKEFSPGDIITLTDSSGTHVRFLLLEKPACKKPHRGVGAKAINLKTMEIVFIKLDPSAHEIQHFTPVALTSNVVNSSLWKDEAGIDVLVSHYIDLPKKKWISHSEAYEVNDYILVDKIGLPHEEYAWLLCDLFSQMMEAVSKITKATDYRSLEVYDKHTLIDKNGTPIIIDYPDELTNILEFGHFKRRFKRWYDLKFQSTQDTEQDQLIKDVSSLIDAAKEQTEDHFKFMAEGFEKLRDSLCYPRSLTVEAGTPEERKVVIEDEVPKKWVQDALDEIEKQEDPFPGSERILQLLNRINTEDAVVEAGDKSAKFKRIRFARNIGATARICRHPDYEGEIFILIDSSFKKIFRDNNVNIETNPNNRDTLVRFLAAKLIHETVELINEHDCNWSDPLDPELTNTEFAAYYGEVAFLSQFGEEFIDTLEGMLSEQAKRAPPAIIKMYRAAFEKLEVDDLFIDMNENNPIRIFLKELGYDNDKNPFNDARASLYVKNAGLFKPIYVRNRVLYDFLDGYSGELKAALRELLPEHPFPTIFLDDLIKERDYTSWADFGCGTGNALKQAGQNTYLKCRLTGVDVSQPATPPENFEFIEADIHNVKLEEKVDLITLVGVLDYLYDPVRTIINAYNNLNEGGTLLATIRTVGGPHTNINNLCQQLKEALDGIGIESIINTKDNFIYMKRGSKLLKQNVTLQGLKRYAFLQDGYICDKYRHKYSKIDTKKPIVVFADDPDVPDLPARFTFVDVDTIPLRAPHLSGSRKAEDDAWKNPDAEKTRYRDELIQNHMPLARRIAYSIARKLPSKIDVNDLLGAARLGLTQAAGNFDPDRGTTFEQYASARITGAVYDELRAMDFLPKDERLLVKKYEETFRRLATSLGREPKRKEIAREMNISVPRVETLEIESKILHSEHSEVTEHETHRKKPAVYEDELHEMLDITAQKSFINRLVYILPERMQRFYWLRYDNNMLLREVGEALGFTTSRACQINTAMTKLLKQIKQVIDGKEDSVIIRGGAFTREELLSIINEPEKNPIGKRIRALRHRLSLRNLANSIGVTTHILRAWENGTGIPHKEHIGKLSAVFSRIYRVEIKPHTIDPDYTKHKMAIPIHDLREKIGYVARPLEGRDLTVADIMFHPEIDPAQLDPEDKNTRGLLITDEFDKLLTRPDLTEKDREELCRIYIESFRPLIERLYECITETGIRRIKKFPGNPNKRQGFWDGKKGLLHQAIVIQCFFRNKLKIKLEVDGDRRIIDERLRSLKGQKRFLARFGVTGWQQLFLKSGFHLKGLLDTAQKRGMSLFDILNNAYPWLFDYSTEEGQHLHYSCFPRGPTFRDKKQRKEFAKREFRHFLEAKGHMGFTMRYNKITGKRIIDDRLFPEESKKYLRKKLYDRDAETQEYSWDMLFKKLGISNLLDYSFNSSFYTALRKCYPWVFNLNTPEGEHLHIWDFSYQGLYKGKRGIDTLGVAIRHIFEKHLGAKIERGEQLDIRLLSRIGIRTLLQQEGHTITSLSKLLEKYNIELFADRVLRNLTQETLTKLRNGRGIRSSEIKTSEKAPSRTIHAIDCLRLACPWAFDLRTSEGMHIHFWHFEKMMSPMTKDGEIELEIAFRHILEKHLGLIDPSNKKVSKMLLTENHEKILYKLGVPDWEAYFAEEGLGYAFLKIFKCNIKNVLQKYYPWIFDINTSEESHLHDGDITFVRPWDDDLTFNKLKKVGRHIVSKHLRLQPTKAVLTKNVTLETLTRAGFSRKTLRERYGNSIPLFLYHCFPECFPEADKEIVEFGLWIAVFRSRPINWDKVPRKIKRWFIDAVLISRDINVDKISTGYFTNPSCRLLGNKALRGLLVHYKRRGMSNKDALEEIITKIIDGTRSKSLHKRFGVGEETPQETLVRLEAEFGFVDEDTVDSIVKDERYTMRLNITRTLINIFELRTIDPELAEPDDLKDIFYADERAKIQNAIDERHHTLRELLDLVNERPSQEIPEDVLGAFLDELGIECRKIDEDLARECLDSAV